MALVRWIKDFRPLFGQMASEKEQQKAVQMQDLGSPGFEMQK